MSHLEIRTDEESLASDIAALEAFVLENGELVELEQHLAGFNLFEALGNVRREERHSDFLAFLLDPTQPHGLDERILQAFIQVAVSSPPEEPSPMRRIDAALLELSDSRVEREWNNIDILATSESERFVLLVENKVYSDEHSDQLRRYLDIVRSKYPDWSVLPVFLTRDGQIASHPAYHSVSHGDVHGILKGLLDRQASTLLPDVEVAIRHYTEMLERHIMDDTPIAELARKIYARHGRALEIIFEHRPDAAEMMRQEIVAAIEEHSGVELVYSSKSFIHFVPKEWGELQCLANGGDGSWNRRPELLRFEFRQYEGALSMHLNLGPGEVKLRRWLHDWTGKVDFKDLFKHRSAKPGQKWTQLWRLSILSKKRGNELTVEERRERFREVWKGFVDSSLGNLTTAVNDIVRGYEGPESFPPGA